MAASIHRWMTIQRFHLIYDMETHPCDSCFYKGGCSLCEECINGSLRQDSEQIETEDYHDSLTSTTDARPSNS
jgi:radical SAM superfamily enzyme with C-terminal helix-hairpin-helix motif